jgi:hypothetical protein
MKSSNLSKIVENGRLFAGHSGGSHDWSYQPGRYSRAQAAREARSEIESAQQERETLQRQNLSLLAALEERLGLA